MPCSRLTVFRMNTCLIVKAVIVQFIVLSLPCVISKYRESNGYRNKYDHEYDPLDLRIQRWLLRYLVDGSGQQVKNSDRCQRHPKQSSKLFDGGHVICF